VARVAEYERSNQGGNIRSEIGRSSRRRVGQISARGMGENDIVDPSPAHRGQSGDLGIGGTGGSQVQDKLVADDLGITSRRHEEEGWSV
jgi:hypothetical protein